MCSKGAILFLGLLAMLFLIFSNVAARDLTETYSNSKNAATDINELVGGVYPGGGDYGGGYFNFGGYPGGGIGGGFGFRGGFPGRGGLPGGFPGRGGFGGSGGRGFCRYGCCGTAYVGGCTGCCRYAGQAFVVQTRN